MLRYVIYTKELPWDPNEIIGQAGSEFAAMSIIESFCDREILKGTLQPYKTGFYGIRHVNYDMDIKENQGCYIWYEDTQKGL